MMRQKTCAAIHDLSGMGKCSLTAALPVLSAAGVSVACLPTAVLSTQTGGLNEYTYRDLTADMRPVMAHWHKLGARFDAVYSGFLGSREQVDIVLDFLTIFGECGGKPLFLCDPAMADNGRLYDTFSPDFIPEMVRLSSRADIIVPNVTEAAMLAGADYREAYDLDYINGIAGKLRDTLGVERIVITGVNSASGIGAAAFDGGEMQMICTERVPGMFHSTGDLFASALLGCVLNDVNLIDSVRIAAGFVLKSIRKTVSFGGDSRFGLAFEPCLADYIASLRNIKK